MVICHGYTVSLTLIANSVAMMQGQLRSSFHQRALARHAARGFTLIEIMVVVVILGILAALVVPKIMSRPDEARIIAAKQDIASISQALKLYRLDNGRYPTTEQGISALVTKPTTEPIPNNWKGGGYLERLPKDPWGHPYQYLNPGVRGEVDVFSFAMCLVELADQKLPWSGVVAARRGRPRCACGGAGVGEDAQGRERGRLAPGEESR